MPTVLVTGASAGGGLGQGLVDHFAGQGAMVIATARSPARTRAPHVLTLDVASEASLFQLGQRLRQIDLRIDLLLNLASVRQIVSLDRLDLHRRKPPLSFEILATLRVAHAVLDRLADGVRVVCVAGSPHSASEFGSLSRPPRVSSVGLHAGLRALAADLAGKHGVLAMLDPGPGPVPETTPRTTHDTLDDQLAWIAATIDNLRQRPPPQPPEPLFFWRQS